MEYQYARTYRGPVQLVVFDWAGTMVDFGCQAPVAAFAEGFRLKGIDITSDQARKPMGMEKRDHIKTITEMSDIAAAWEEKYGRQVNDGDIDSMFHEFVPLLMKILPSHSRLIPGVKDAVEELRRQGIKIGATTGYFKEAAQIVAGCAAREGYIPDAAVSSSDVHIGRPAPWMIYRIMEMLNVHPAESVVNIGDTPVDIESGLNAGTWSIGVAATGNETGLSETEFSAMSAAKKTALVSSAREKLTRAGAHRVIDTMKELPGVVADINAILRRGGKP